MKKDIYYYSKEEWYPVYVLTLDSYWSDEDIDIPDELYDEYIKVEEQFNTVQKKIRALLVEQGKNR